MLQVEIVSAVPVPVQAYFIYVQYDFRINLHKVVHIFFNFFSTRIFFTVEYILYAS